MIENHWKRAPLNELLELNESGTWGEEGSSGDHPVLRSSNIHDGQLVLDDVAYRKVSSRDVERYRLDDGDIIVTKSSGSPHLIGKSCLFMNPDGRTYLFSNFTQRLRARKDILDSRFLYFFLASPIAKDYLQKISNTTSGLRNLSMKDYGRQAVPLPPLPIQKQIAAILEKADAAREKRRQANQLTEQFLQSAFLEMFGDPVTNPKGWRSIKLGELGELERGRSKHRPRNAAHLLGGPHPLIQTGEIANSSGYITSYTQTYSDAGLKQSRMWPKGTLCITIAANIGKTAILTFDACFPDSIVGFTPNGMVNTEFIQQWFSFVQQQLEESAPMVAQKNINLEILRKQNVPVPPMEKQQQFAALVEKVEGLRGKQRESEKELENLFNSLMQRAFKGELVG